MSVDVSSAPVVQRWRRYGHDRAYVRVGDRQLGYRDLKNGEVCCESVADTSLVTEVTAALWDEVRTRPGTRLPPRRPNRRRWNPTTTWR